MRQLIISLPLMLVGCGTVESPATLDQELSSSFGGQTTADEEPAFGDPELRAMTAAEAVADATPARPDAIHIPIAVMWGYLAPHPDATETIDWSGRITATNAAIRVIRPLAFEEQDAVVRPRTDRSVIEFDSQTRPHADGLLLDVILAPELNPEHQPVTLTLATPPYTGTLTLEPGMRLARVIPVDDAGHVVAYHIVRPARADGGEACAEGFLRGEWQTRAETDGRVLGELKGVFTAADGTIRGHLRGLFGTRKNGHQVWFAKIVDADGKLIGVVAGRWADGKLAGLVLGRGRLVRGMVRGEYSDGPDGTFMGRYSERCAEADGEGSATDTDEPMVSLEEEGSDA